MDTQATTPLSEATVLIMLSLSPGPKHGYAIMKDVQVLSEGRVILSTGTLYGAIKRLLADGWIKREEAIELEVPHDEAGGRERKYYTLTRGGRRTLSTEVQRMRGLVAIAADRLAQGVDSGQD